LRAAPMVLCVRKQYDREPAAVRVRGEGG